MKVLFNDCGPNQGGQIGVADLEQREVTVSEKGDTKTITWKEYLSSSNYDSLGSPEARLIGVLGTRDKTNGLWAGKETLIGKRLEEYVKIQEVIYNNSRVIHQIQKPSGNAEPSPEISQQLRNMLTATSDTGAPLSPEYDDLLNKYLGQSDLPPKDSQPTPKNIAKLRAELTAHMSGGPKARNTYDFYLLIDKYLGPWKEKGYPINYGVKYNLAFTTNSWLKKDSVAQDWVARTTRKLHEALTEYIVDRYKKGTLKDLTETELREVAFASHSNAYQASGLANVAANNPLILPIVAAIPRKEFLPTSDNFGATLAQVAETAVGTMPDVIGAALATSLLAHSGSAQITNGREGIVKLAQASRLAASLESLKTEIKSGKITMVNELDEIANTLLSGTFPPELTPVVRDILRSLEKAKSNLSG